MNNNGLLHDHSRGYRFLTLGRNQYPTTPNQCSTEWYVVVNGKLINKAQATHFDFLLTVGGEHNRENEHDCRNKFGTRMILHSISHLSILIDSWKLVSSKGIPQLQRVVTFVFLIHTKLRTCHITKTSREKNGEYRYDDNKDEV
jgi:hypothetical protein